MTGTTNEAKAKASFLLMMGSEAYEIYKTLKKSDDSDTLDDVIAFMTKRLLVKRSEFTEICIFRRAKKRNDERVEEYCMRLRQLAAHCKFSNNDKEILSQLVIGSSMPEFKDECCQTESLSLTKALEIARG